MPRCRHGSGPRSSPGRPISTLKAVAVQLGLPDGEHAEFQIKSGVLKARTQNQHILASLNVGLPDTGTIQGMLTLPVSALPLPGFAGPRGAPLKGRLSATLTDLTLLPHFIPKVENTRGTLKTVIDIGGTVAHPSLTGHAELNDGSLTIPTLGTQLTHVALSAKSNDGKIVTLEGSAQSGGGTITVKSSARLASVADQTITLDIKSNRFEVVKIPEAWVLATTDLSLKISTSSLEYSGDVFIPEAKLSPRDLSSAVSVSNDTQIVNGSLPQPKTAGRSVQGLINIRLGDKVHFNGFGLTAQVKGNLAIRQNPGLPSVGYGTLNVTGEYKAYGQRLAIEQGRLAFVGTPVDNPGLDIKAVRKIQTVSAGNTITAGINVIGTLKKPRITIFSDPAMDDTDALSYLILGRPVNEASSQEGSRLAGAATALGLTGGEFLAKKIGKMFGIEDVEMKTNPDTQSPSLVLGTYLSPRLYVSYGYGLLDAVNTLQLRYSLSSKWTLEAQSGVIQRRGPGLYDRNPLGARKSNHATVAASSPTVWDHAALMMPGCATSRRSSMSAWRSMTLCWSITKSCIRSRRALYSRWISACATASQSASQPHGLVKTRSTPTELMASNKTPTSHCEVMMTIAACCCSLLSCLAKSISPPAQHPAITTSNRHCPARRRACAVSL